MISILTSMGVITHCRFICISLMASDAEHLFTYPLTFSISSLEKHLFRYFVPFYLGCLLFLLLSGMSSLYVLDINPLSDIYFFHSVGGFFCCPEALYFDTGPLVYFWFCCSCFKGLFQGRCRYSSVPGILSMHVSLIWSCRWWKAAPLRWSFFPVCVFLGLGMEHGGLWALGRRAPHARTAQLPGLCLWKKFLKKQIRIE